MKDICYSGSEYMEMARLNNLFQWMTAGGWAVPVTEEEFLRFHRAWVKHQRKEARSHSQQGSGATVE